MGDAGPPTPTSGLDDGQFTLTSPETSLREIHVLVTGFGAFKSFNNNPSWLIAESLPEIIHPISSSNPETTAPPTTFQKPTPIFPPNIRIRALSTPAVPILPIRRPDTRPYVIKVHTYPEAVRVAYASTSALIPSLLDPLTNTPVFGGIDFDYILHIGLASGRDSYTLETIGHRDLYRIHDVDGKEGKLAGELPWKELGVPECLEVGWHGADVLSRWERGVRELEGREREDFDPLKLTQADNNKAARMARPAVVKLSRDAGRYLCEFILMCSLTYRWLHAQKKEVKPQASQNRPDDRQGPQESTTTYPDTEKHSWHSQPEKLGKTAFLHVPNGSEEQDIARGRRVAVSAISAVVASWEAGFRNGNVYKAEEIPAHIIQEASVTSPSNVLGVGTEAFESKTTGDA